VLIINLATILNESEIFIMLIFFSSLLLPMRAERLWALSISPRENQLQYLYSCMRITFTILYIFSRVLWIYTLKNTLSSFFYNVGYLNSERYLQNFSKISHFHVVLYLNNEILKIKTRRVREKYVEQQKKKFTCVLWELEPINFVP
jgi:hypothetical protein